MAIWGTEFPSLMTRRVYNHVPTLVPYPSGEEDSLEGGLMPHSGLHLEGHLRDHRLIRKLSGNSKTSSYLAEDGAGRQSVLTFLERTEILERMRFRAHHQGLSAEEAERVASEWYARYEEQHKKIIERIKGLSHEHVAETHGVGYDQEHHRLVTISEYTPGVDLFYATRGLTPVQMLSLFSQMLDGLRFIHKNGLLHLNLKPARVRVDLERNPPLVKLTDFGFAVPRENYTEEYSGTPLYMAPEVVMNDRSHVDERADLYAFGIIAYYCITGRHPLEHRLHAKKDRGKLCEIVSREGIISPPSHYHRGLDPKFDELILQLTHRDPAQRKFRNVTDVLHSLDQHWPEAAHQMPHEVTSTLVE